MKLLTFNILCPKLCNSSQFLNYPPECLDEKIRMNKIFSFLSQWIKEKYILALQEVPISYRGNLERFFYNKNYYFSCSSYGNDYADNMGIAIAFPIDLYEIIDIEYIRVGSLIKIRKKNTSNNFFDKIFNHLSNLNFNSHFNKKKELNNDEIIKQASFRKNRTIYIGLREKSSGKQFTLLNYHMPCTFKEPNIQLLHIDALKKIAKKSINPTIVCGDFNMTPNSELYSYMTGQISKNDDLIKNAANVFQKYESAYKEANTAEPEFTIYSNTNFGGLFKNTLDYIFLSKGNWKVNSSTKFLETDDLMPNSICPSDHIPILADIELV